MWILKNVDTGECFYATREKIKYTIGRLGADLVLLDDSSVSRSHAFLQLSENVNEPLKLTDSASKYGTFVNEGIGKNTRIGKNQVIVLREGDRIRFGVLKNYWCVVRMQLTTMASSLSPVQSNAFEKLVRTLDGEVLQQWTENCTHLTMNEISTTVKLLFALVEQIPVVTCAYWRDLLLAIREKKVSLPTPQQYFPRPSEALMQRKIQDLSRQLDRKSIFANMSFVFMNRKQYETYTSLVERAGGTCKELRTGISKSFLVRKNVVVVQYVPSTQSQSSQSFDELADYLEKKSLRLVPEYEIGLAILDCSTAKYCNASYKIVSNSITPSMLLETEKRSERIVCVENTRNSTFNSSSASIDVYVPETDPCCSTSRSIKKTIANKTSKSVEKNADTDMQETEPFEKGLSRLEQSKVQQQRKRNANDLLHDNQNQIIEDFEFSTGPPSAKKSKVNGNNDDDKNAKPMQPKPQGVATTPHVTTNSAAISESQCAKTYSISGFLEKSHISNECIVNNSTAIETNEVTNDKPVTRKRTRIAVISEEDDDDDLFNFNDDKDVQPKKTKNNHNVSNDPDDDSDENLFGFTGLQQKRTPSTQSEAVDDDNEEMIPTETFVPKQNTNVDYVLPKPKPLPEKVNTADWLACSFDNIKMDSEIIKSECDVSTVKEEDEEESLSQQKWLNSLKGCFKVRRTSLHLMPLARNVEAQRSVNNPSISLSKSVKNFKTFKKCNIRYQDRVVITCDPFVRRNMSG